MSPTQLLSYSDVMALTKRDRRTIWAWVRDNKFPQPIKMNGRAIGWPVSAYESWVAGGAK
ncbi:helix-turn-helix transcriptional regulator [Aeromonas veronii]|uniref:helix-turn-helix transcriptional regulator n=1 Tax=Aeromonas veronii TaxID=654 RepID=UPI0030057E1D